MTLQGKMGKVIVVVSVCEGVAVCACRTGPAAVPRGSALAGLVVLVTKRGCVTVSVPRPSGRARHACVC